MPDSQKTSKTEYLLAVLLLLVLVAYALLFGFLNFRGFARLALADMYADTLCARLMWEAKSLFPRRFLFGNQFYVVATPVLAALFYGLCGSMNTAMALATTVMSLLILLSMDWMLRPVLKKPWQRLAALLAFVGLLFGPGSARREDGTQLFFVLCSYYACYVITEFVVLGDYARARLSGDRRLPALLLAAFLCFCTGIQSLRQTCITVLPLLGFEGIGLLRRLIRHEPAFPPKRRPVLARAGVYTLANLLGLVAIRLIHPLQHTIYRGSSLFSGSSLAQELAEVRKALTVVTGYEYTKSAIGGPFFTVMFVFCLLLVAWALVLLLRAWRCEADASALFWLLSLLACAAVIAASLFTSVSLRAIYLFPWYFLPALSYAVLAARIRPLYTKLVTGFLILLAACNLYFSYRNDVEAVLSEVPTPAQQVCDYALENGYRYLYGNQSLGAPQIAVYSDGRLIAGCWEDACIFKVSPHINIRDIYHYHGDVEHALFVFLPWELEDALAEAAANGTELTLIGQYGQYAVYSSSHQLLYPITETIDFNPEYN